MPAPNFTSDDFLVALAHHLPRGRVWPRDVDSVVMKVLSGLAPSIAAVANRATDLLPEIRPDTTVELLPDWEATLGLPDPCAGDPGPLAARREQVVSRFTNTGGQSVPYFVALAKSLGYDITIQEFAATTFGEPFLSFGGDAWAHVWQVNGPVFTSRPFQFGISAFGEPFASWNNEVLVCEFQRLKPAHTIVLFNFSG